MTFGLRRRLLAVAFLASLVAFVSIGVTSASAQQQAAAASVTQTVTGTCTLATGEAGTFAGTVSVTRFVLRQGQILAQGTLTGTCTGLTTGATQTINQAFSVPITILQSTCTILVLQTGPIHLELLGLVVDISPILITITGQTGTLLGGLLCGLANALQSGASLSSIVQLLNQILAAL